MKTMTNTIKSPYFFMLWLLLVVLSYFFIDRPLATFFGAITNPLIMRSSELITYVGEGWFYIIGFALWFLLSKFIWQKKQLALTALFLFLAVAVPGILCDVVKVILGRARPHEFFSDHLFGFYFFQSKDVMWSFPSGHATTVGGLVVALSYLYPRYSGVFFLVFFMVCLSRLIVTAHYLSDVMMGAYLGAISVIWLIEQFQKRGLMIAKPSVPIQQPFPHKS